METKLCKHCKSEIPKEAKVCPNCCKKQGGIIKWIIIIVVILIVLGAMGESDDGDGDDTGKSGAKDSSVSKGESFEANGLKVTIKDVETNYTDYDDKYDLYKPEEGYKYIMVSFVYENTGESDAYVSIYDYDCYADGTLCDQTYYFGNDFINANISSGRNVSFETYYVVPIDAEEIELEYTANIWTDEKVVIEIQ